MVEGFSLKCALLIPCVVDCYSPYCIDLEMAVAYWNLVLTGRFKFLDLWNRFLLVSGGPRTILSVLCTDLKTCDSMNNECEPGYQFE